MKLRNLMIGSKNKIWKPEKFRITKHLKQILDIS